MHELIVFTTALLIAMIAYVHYDYLRFLLRCLVMLPAFVEYAVRYSVFRFRSKRLSGNFELGKRFKKLSRGKIGFLKLEEEILEVFRDFEGEEEMALRLKKNVPHRYTPIAERDSESNEPKTVLLFQRVPSLKAAKTQDKSYRIDNKGRLKSTHLKESKVLLTVQGFVGWENVMTEDGNVIQFGDPQEMYDMLDADLQDELEAVFGGGSYSAKAEERLLNPDEDEDDEDDEDGGDEDADDEDADDGASG